MADYVATCRTCGAEFDAQRSDAASCSAVCRARRSRQRRAAYGLAWRDEYRSRVAEIAERHDVLSRADVVDPSAVAALATSIADLTPASISASFAAVFGEDATPERLTDAGMARLVLAT